MIAITLQRKIKGGTTIEHKSQYNLSDTISAQYVNASQTFFSQYIENCR